MQTILYVGNSKEMESMLKETGRTVDSVQNGMIAMNALSSNPYSAVVIEDQLPLISASRLISELKNHSQVPVISLLRDNERRNQLMDDFKIGLFGWFEPKNSSVDQLEKLIGNAADFQKFVQGLPKGQQKQMTPCGLSDLVGVSPAMRKVFQLLLQIQSKDVITILYGESGTGKTLTAKTIHRNGRRYQRPFIAVNCPAIPSELLESELFGHEKGSFTGAIERRDGKFIAANGGTIFLDEIGDMSPSLQAKILRALESGEIERVGSAETLNVDVRVISATNQDLQEKIRQKTFRQDLYHRINVFPVTMPPLRDRPEDIPLIALNILNKFKEKHHTSVCYFDPNAQELLMEYSWPGNVRELENALERTVLISDETHLRAKDIEPLLDNHLQLEQGSSQSSDSADSDGMSPGQEIPEPIMSLKEVEMKAIKATVERNRWNLTHSAQQLGVSRMTLYRKLEQYGLRKRN